MRTEKERRAWLIFAIKVCPAWKRPRAAQQLGGVFDCFAGGEAPEKRLIPGSVSCKSELGFQDGNRSVGFFKSLLTPYPVGSKSAVLGFSNKEVTLTKEYRTTVFSLFP